MGVDSVAGSDDLEEGVRVGGAALELDGQGGKQQDLHCRPGRVPVTKATSATGYTSLKQLYRRARDTVAIGDAGGLEQRGGPGPAADDGRGDEAALDGAAGGGEHLRGLQLIVVALEDEGGQDHAQGEGKAEAQDDSISEALGEAGGRSHGRCVDRLPETQGSPAMHASAGRGRTGEPG